MLLSDVCDWFLGLDRDTGDPERGVTMLTDSMLLSLEESESGVLDLLLGF